MKTRLILLASFFIAFFIMLLHLGIDHKAIQYHHTAPIQAPDSPVEQSTPEIWRITAYCPEKCCCGEFADGITASGAPAEGLIIAAPKEIPFGTQFYIPGYGWATVQDRGGAIKGKRLDLLFSDHQEALNWGVKYFEKRGNKFDRQ